MFNYRNHSETLQHIAWK